ncbi:histidine kinase [Fluviibacter phosphoraccumulans]|uniref:Sensor protein n=2 Tax=Fluviibacter phosphoraccumulans TaxID=1751046 RepID=A0A679HWB4_9RHOO|nr:histidine kinase [Fluviibacter phosphoraccumulans]BBU71672.1 histidine kinase [Fluviibacter phosphoraccumulans]BCA65107.1 histidine kinase [Fluviibacter phosphoraccumulans]
MMSYRLLGYAETGAPHERIADASAEFQIRLDALQDFVVSRAADYSELPARFEQVHNNWENNISPALLGLHGKPDAATVARLESAIPAFVTQISDVVFLIEQDLEQKISLLRSLQIALLTMTVIVCLVTMWMMKNQVVRPLTDLLHAASRVRDKDFSAKAHHIDQDELGQLGVAFNMMVAEIATTYDNQNRLIAERTSELTDTNRSLELMYKSALQLSDKNITSSMLKGLLDDIEAELGLSAGTICISEHSVFPAHRLTSNLLKSDLENLCGERGCEDCFKTSQNTSYVDENNGQKMIFIPIKNVGSITGVMPFRINASEKIPEWKIRVLEAIGSNLSMALSKMQHQEELHRVAVLEERSVIARELHDSIAQSLSYLRIQVARLEKNQLTPEHQYEIVTELKSGLASAYKELRELISAFRLKIDERGFQTALIETTEEYSRRCNIPINCHNDLPPTLLSANEEIHVLRIIREALANIDKHAQATEVGISATLTDNQVVVISITDNGIGIGDTQSPENHYGLIIMEDRAQSLDGVITIRNRDQGGTEVLLTFIPEKSEIQS